MAKVLGIGGVFVKSKNPEALREWYRDMLGMELASWGGSQLWNQGKSYGVWAAFASDTKHYEPSTKEFMINFRVDDVGALVVKLREKGVKVLDRKEDTDDGMFRYVMDPEGTLLELWQPAQFN